MWFRRRLDVDVKRAGPGAAGLFAALHALSFPDPWSERSFTAFLHLRNTTGQLAWTGEAAVGFALTRVAMEEAELLTIGVEPNARRHGVGRALLSAAIDHALDAGAGVMHLEVAVANAAARRLYAMIGFQEVGRRPSYYADGGDALTCQLRLTSGVLVTRRPNPPRMPT